LNVAVLRRKRLVRAMNKVSRNSRDAWPAKLRRNGRNLADSRLQRGGMRSWCNMLVLEAQRPEEA